MVNTLSHTVGRLESWLEGTRRPVRGDEASSGYGGPVVHWWRDSLLFCGPGFDWRYEGIILGYLALYRNSGQRRWLEKAVRAGDDLLAAQLPNGNYRHSAFELNPASGGTPHEAAADVGLLALACALKGNADAADWSKYVAAARNNLQRFYVARLWDADARLFRDDPTQPSFVANKSATLTDALFLLSDVTGEDTWLERHARPTLDAIVRHQVRRRGDPLDGGIAQSSSGRVVVEKYFPYYIARCIPALLEGARRFGDERYLDAALGAGRFLMSWRDPDGAFPQVVYPGGRVNRYPRWIAAVGDVLRAFDLLRTRSVSIDLEPTLQWLLDGQLPDGAFKSADGFSSQISQRTPHGLADMRDFLPVVGWNDKAFRYLASQVKTIDERPPTVALAPVSCCYRGAPAELRQRDKTIELLQSDKVVYRWPACATWAEAA